MTVCLDGVPFRSATQPRNISPPQPDREGTCQLLTRRSSDLMDLSGTLSVPRSPGPGSGPGGLTARRMWSETIDMTTITSDSSPGVRGKVKPSVLYVGNEVVRGRDGEQKRSVTCCGALSEGLAAWRWWRGSQV